jgi:hypothetical protein
MYDIESCGGRGDGNRRMVRVDTECRVVQVVRLYTWPIIVPSLQERYSEHNLVEAIDKCTSREECDIVKRAVYGSLGGNQIGGIATNECTVVVGLVSMFAKD